MTPSVTKRGNSFKGAFQYYMHDKGGAKTRDRVAWTQTENMMTDDPDKAWRVMAYTARENERLKEASGQTRVGKKMSKPVFAYSLSWHPEQNPDKDHMLDTARSTMDMLGLSEHEAVIVAHRDEPQPHVHVIVNTVHPVTGMVNTVQDYKERFSDFAREYEREHGKIYCQQREENYEKRLKGEFVRYADPVIKSAWENTDCGRDFKTALDSQGYQLARGRKRVVIVDPYGQAHNPTRVLKNVKARQIQERLSDIEIEKLPDADEVIKSIAEAAKPNQDKDIEQKLAVFEKLASIRLNSLEETHYNQKDRLKLQYDRRLDAAKVRLANFYDLPRKKREIAELKTRTKDPPWWKQLLRISKRERQELKEKLLAYKNSVFRYREKLTSITNQRDRDMIVLKKRQHSERVKVELHIDKQRQSGNYEISSELSYKPRKREQDRGGISWEM